jgi:bifunctional UDP-N-acetylglucosamine pyrophosphorylase/glucosamine-1-phosphate N-acetyltransferase
MQTGIVILAAGSGSRLKLGPKPLVPFLGQPMILHLLAKLPNAPYFIIISPKDEALFKESIGEHPYLFQSQPLGTAHALWSQSKLKAFKSIIILNADTPLVPSTLIKKIYHDPISNILVGFETNDTESYGQIEIKDGKAIRITEKKDRKNHLSSICFSGIMKLSQENLQKIETLPPSPITKEYYLTSIVSLKNPFHLLLHPKPDLLGVNTFDELIELEALYKKSQYHDLLIKKTTISDHQNLYFSFSQIGSNCKLASLVSITHSSIGNHCHIGQGAILDHVTLGDHVTIKPYTILSNCQISSHAQIGPFAHIQDNTQIGQYSQIGNFVEIKRSRIANYVKAKHLTYLGDAYVDHKANIGAGTITCNYVPWRRKKSLTYIGSNTLIGANCLLIAPCHIGPYSVCAAGSVIQGNILPQQLAISRSSLDTHTFTKLKELSVD